MNPNLSNKDQIILEQLDQVEILVLQGKLDQAKALIKSHRANGVRLDREMHANLDFLESLILHANLEYEAGLEKALSSFEYFRSSSDNRKIGKVQKIIAKIRMDMGALEEAEQVFRDCLATWRRIRDNTGIFECYNRLGQIKYIKGDYNASADFLIKAIDSFRESARESLEAEITLMRYSGNLARIYLRVGRWNEAEKLLRECIAHNRRHDVKDSLIRNLLSLGYIGIRRRDQRLCEDCFAEVQQLLEDTQLKWDEGVLYEYLGEYYTEFNKFDEALKAYGKVLKIAERLPARNTLITQTLRRRAELYLAMAKYNLAYADAERALKIARDIPEQVEVLASLRVLAQVSQKYDKADKSVDYFSEVRRIIPTMQEKFEIARTHLAFASINLENGNPEQLNSSRLHLNQALEIFGNLEADYYLAVTRLVEAELHKISGNFDAALNAVSKAEDLFEKVGGVDDIKAVFGLRRQIEKQMVDLAVSDENEFNQVRAIIEPSEYVNLRQADLSQSLQFLAERIAADEAFVGLIDFGEDSIQPLANFEFDQKNLTELKEIIKYTAVNAENLKPFFITAPYQTSNGSAELFRNFKEVGSMILIPMDLGSQKSAIVYLQRNAKDSSNICFNKSELNLSVAFADILAFRTMEHLKANLEEENFRLRSQLAESCAFPNIITGNKDMFKMLERVIQVKDSPIAILILGETGSGKDLLAKTIHYNSVRKDKRFISVNCAALPETLLESELFGYKKGAFTGADRDRAGLFEEADGGTFFLDEIGEMPLSIQAKLLRVIEDQEVVRLGDTRSRKVDVRLLSATNSDLKDMMEKGTFRQDLFYRLSAMRLEIPPLRKRKDDIPLLLSHFLSKYDPSVRLDSEVRQIFINFHWPGNVRELDNEIKKLVLLAGDKKKVTKEILSHKFFKDSAGNKEIELPEIETFEQGFTLYDYIAMFEQKYIKDALIRNRWIKKHAANSLGIPESTLRLKIKEYNIAKDA